MNIDIFILARLGSSRLPEKHLKKILGVPVIIHLINRVKKAEKIRKIIVCTTNLKSDDKLCDFLKNNNIEFFRGDSNDVIKRILDAAIFFKTDYIIDVEGDKIYTDPEFIDMISNELQKNYYDYVTGNSLKEKFEPSHAIHGIIPAGFSVDAIKKMYTHKKTNNTETGYREYFLSNEFKTKFIIPESIIKFPKNLRLFLDYPEDLIMAKEIFEKIGNDFKLEELLKHLEKNPHLCKITENVVDKWIENYNKTKTFHK